jgi:adenylate kinase family enzyme
MKTVIIGNSGSGKTWLARAISSAMAAPVVHLDDIFWEPGGFDQKRSSETVNALILKVKAEERWIVEGVFGELAQQFLRDADQLIWLDLEWSVCRERLSNRGSESKMHLERKQSDDGLRRLLEWAEKYHERSDMRSHQGHMALFKAFNGARLRLQSEHEVADYVRNIQHSTSVGGADAPPLG